MSKILKRFAGGIISGALIAASISVASCNQQYSFSSTAENETYSLHINTSNKVVDSKINNDNGYQLWMKADSNSGVNFAYNSSSFSIQKGGYIQNLSAVHGIKSISVSLESGSLSLYHFWSEPSDLESAEYESGKTFTTSETYTYSDVNPDYFRLVANVDTVIRDICVNYSCSGSTDSNAESFEYGLENGFFDTGSLNRYARTAFVTDTCSDESNRALKLTFDGTTNNYLSLDTAHNTRRGYTESNPSFADKVFSFKAKCSENITEKAFEVCAIGSSWSESGYIRASYTAEDENGWAYYSVDFSELSFADNNNIIRVNIRPKGINTINKSTAYVLLDEIRYEVAQKDRYYKSELIRDSLENMAHDTGWENLNYSYSATDTFGYESTSSLKLKGLKSGKSKNNQYKYFTSFSISENRYLAFYDVPDFSTGYLTFNYKPVNTVSVNTIYYGVLFDWGTNQSVGTISGSYLFNGWYEATIDLASLGTTATADGAIRLNLGWDIPDAQLNSSVIYIDNMRYVASAETYTQGYENLPHDTGWERCFYSIDYANVASASSKSSVKMTFAGKDRKDTNELGVIWSPASVSGLSSTLDFTQGILEAKFMFSAEVVDKTIRVTLVDSSWNANRYNLTPVALGNGWYYLRIDLASLARTGSYTGQGIIRFGFGFFGVTDAVKSTATVWVDEVFYTNTSYSALSSYTNATFYQSYETENYINTAKAVSDRTISDSNPLKFAGLKNDVESNQFVIKMKSGKSLSSYNFRMESLRDSGGHILDSSCFEILVPQYLAVTSKSAEKNGSSYGWQGAGNYPDPLLPIENVVASGTNKIASRTSATYGGYQQSLWINVNIPEYIKSGTYTGNGILTIDSVEYRVPVQVTVYGATLSEEEHNKTCFLLWWDQLVYGEGSSMSREYRRLYYDFLTSKRINADGVRAADWYDSGEEFAEYFAENIAFNKKISTYRLPLTSGTTLDYDTIYEYLNALIDKNLELASEGQNVNFFDKLILYFHDEPSTTSEWNNVATTKTVFNQVKSALASKLNAYPALKQSFLAMRNVTPFNQDYSTTNNQKLDTPCPTFNHLDTTTERTGYIDGFENTWWYGCIIPSLPYVSYHIDSRLIGSRIHTWLQYGLGIEGEVYFCVNYSQRQDPGETSPHAVDPYTDPFCSGMGAGDGRLLYPGMPKGINGPVTSMRLEEIRASMEDYEYFWMIDQRIDKYNAIHGTNYTSISEKLVADYLPSMFSGTQMKSSFTSSSFDSMRLQILQIVDELY